MIVERLSSNYKRKIILNFCAFLLMFSSPKVANSQCSNGSVSLIDWTHQAAGFPGQMIYDPFVSGQNPSIYDETGTFTTTTCSGDQTIMTLDFERTSGNTDGTAGLDYKITQNLNATSKFTLTFTNPVIISDMKIDDVDTRSSYVDRLVFAANNGGTNVPVTLNAVSGVNVSGQIATGATQDGGILTVSTSQPVTEISFTFNNGNNGGGSQFVLIKEGFSFCCPVSCNAGSTAPTLSATAAENACPASTVDLNSLVSSSTTNLEWHRSSTPTATTKYNSSSTATEGTYYAVYYDSANDCYSPASAGVSVTEKDCTDTDQDGVVDVDDLDDDNDGILDTAEGYCQTTTSISNITGGSGTTNTPNFYFFDWSGLGTLNSGDSKTFTLAGGYSITATFSNVSGASLSPSNGGWANCVHCVNTYYDTGTTSALQGFSSNGSQSQFDVTFTLTKDGNAEPINLVLIDGEESNENNEFVQYTTNGTAFSVLEQFGTPNNITSSGNTVTYGPGQTTGNIFYKSKSNTGVITINTVIQYGNGGATGQ